MLYEPSLTIRFDIARCASRVILPLEVYRIFFVQLLLKVLFCVQDLIRRVLSQKVVERQSFLTTNLMHKLLVRDLFSEVWLFLTFFLKTRMEPATNDIEQDFVADRLTSNQRHIFIEGIARVVVHG